MCHENEPVLTPHDKNIFVLVKFDHDISSEIRKSDTSHEGEKHQTDRKICRDEKFGEFNGHFILRPVKEEDKRHDTKQYRRRKKENPNKCAYRKNTPEQRRDAVHTCKSISHGELQKNRRYDMCHTADGFLTMI